MAENKKEQNTQLTFNHLIVTAIAMLVVGYLFGRFSVGVPGSGAAAAAPVAATSISGGPDISALVRAANDAPDTARVWTVLADAYYDTGRPAEAIEAYTKSIAIDGRNPDVLTDRGVMYRQIGDPVQAIRDFDAAAAYDPTHTRSRFNRGIVMYYDLENAELAVAAFEEVLSLDPNFRTPSGALLKDFMDSLR